MLRPDELSIEINNEKKEKILTFINLALDFNKTHNIFSRSSEQEVFEKDVLDSYPITKFIDNKKNILDLGSGGGFPGLVIAIIKPNNNVYLLESNQKKAYFLRKIIDELDIKNGIVINENITKRNNLGTFDIITARAFAKIGKIIELTRNNLKKETEYLLLKGTIQKIKEELKVLDTNQLTYEIIKLENKKQERHIIKIKNK